MRPHNRGIENPRDVLVADGYRAKDLVPSASQRPPMKAVVDRLPRSEAFRKVAPRSACFRNPDDCIDEVPIATF
jgi:hypothetical protein